jgi:hypothetical protein
MPRFTASRSNRCWKTLLADASLDQMHLQNDENVKTIREFVMYDIVFDCEKRK